VADESNEATTLERILAKTPKNTRVVAETVATCALSEFEDQWPDDATDMAAVVCGRWVRKSLRGQRNALPQKDVSYIDRAINSCYFSLTDEQLAATERMVDELERQM
jgi:hypothetical protein